MELAFWICLLIGIGYTVISFALGGLADFAGHVGDIGHFHGDYSHDYGVSGGGHGEASGSNSDGGAVIFGPFSPLVIAFFLTCLGATGILLVKVGHLSPLRSFPIAAASGFLLAWLFITAFNRLLGGLQSSSEVRLNTLIGTEAEVTVAIPSTGVGEIAYVAMGGRNVAPARSDEEVAISRFSSVQISRIVGNMFFVRPMVEEQLRTTEPETTGVSRE